ncbi:Hypothetical predicted protein [Podarcis lilfordi]|uniref:Uncharacterized protein n=1 Tax=Podarcis lilfordi TaxID=74358 RepID=A0AA35PSX8_9SAUR|nr:Hypothetical predicted protein [Podarcis lilfordi]
MYLQKKEYILKMLWDQEIRDFNGCGPLRNHNNWEKAVLKQILLGLLLMYSTFQAVSSGDLSAAAGSLTEQCEIQQPLSTMTLASRKGQKAPKANRGPVREQTKPNSYKVRK